MHLPLQLGQQLMKVERKNNPLLAYRNERLTTLCTMTDENNEAATTHQREPLESDSLLGSNNNNTHEQDNHHHDRTGMLATITEGVLQRMDSFVETTGGVVENVAEMTEQVAHDAQEAILEEIHNIEDGLMEELHEADEGDVFFLEMSLTRNLSILPGDKNLTEAVEEVQELVHPHHGAVDTTAPPGSDEEDGLEKHKQQAVQQVPVTPFSAYILLISAVIALSSIGPFLDLQKGVSPCMKIYWRMTGTAMLLAPLAIRSLVKDGMPRLNGTQWCTFGAAAASYAVMCVAFVLALDYTSVGNAVILANSQSLILLAGKLFVGAPLLCMEGSGALVAFLGAILCSRDHSSMTADAALPEDAASAGWATLYGDCLAMISAIGGVFYLIFGKSLRAVIEDVYVFMFLNMALGSMLTLLYMLITGEDVSFSRNINTGIWGWMNTRADRLPLEIAMVVVCNLMGSLGYVRAFKYFDNLVISVAALMEPVVATFIAFGLGVGVLPGAMGWIGNLLVATGTLAVVYPTVDKGGGGGH